MHKDAFRGQERIAWHRIHRGSASAAFIRKAGVCLQLLSIQSPASPTLPEAFRATNNHDRSSCVHAARKSVELDQCQLVTNEQHDPNGCCENQLHGGNQWFPGS